MASCRSSIAYYHIIAIAGTYVVASEGISSVDSRTAHRMTGEREYVVSAVTFGTFCKELRILVDGNAYILFALHRTGKIVGLWGARYIAEQKDAAEAGICHGCIWKIAGNTLRAYEAFPCHRTCYAIYSPIGLRCEYDVDSLDWNPVIVEMVASAGDCSNEQCYCRRTEFSQQFRQGGQRVRRIGRQLFVMQGQLTDGAS